jgi:hypothetical protein
MLENIFFSFLAPKNILQRSPELKYSVFHSILWIKSYSENWFASMDPSALSAFAIPPDED